MKKAKIDQILLLMVIFVSLFLFAATVSDEMQTRTKYYDLKKITDNAVLTMAKYYANVDQNQAIAENLANGMLEKTKLGQEVKDIISYNWDFTSSPPTIKATITNYPLQTFWYKFFGKENFLLNAESKAKIVASGGSANSTENLSPFAINDQEFTVGDTITLEYDLVANLDFENKNALYPILLNCACESGFIFGKQFDTSSFGDIESCKTQGNSLFNTYIDQLEQLGSTGFAIDFDQTTSSGGLCLLGSTVGNLNATWASQISKVSTTLKKILGNNDTINYQVDFLLVDENGDSTGIVSLLITGVDLKAGSHGYVKIEATVLPQDESGGENILIY